MLTINKKILIAFTIFNLSYVFGENGINLKTQNLINFDKGGNMKNVEVKNSSQRVKINFRCEGMNIYIEGGCFILNGKIINLKPRNFKIDPTKIVNVENELLKIVDEKPNKFKGGTKLRSLIPSRTYHPIPGCLCPNSLVVKSEDGVKIYEEGKDYFVDYYWGAFCRIPTGSIPKDSKVSVSYKYSLQRIDLLQSDIEGNLQLKKGKEEITCPLPPESDEGYYPVANIYLPFHTREISEELIYPIGFPYPSPTEDELKRNSLFVKNTLKKLKNGENVTVVFWGDSVTVGGDASSPENSFPNLFIRYLKEKFPKAKISMINAGIGGSNTNQRLPKFQEEVLKHFPDLVIIEFVNDMKFSEENLIKNYYQAIDLIKEQGGEVIIITPHFTMPSMMNLSSIKNAKETREAVEVLRKIANEKKVGLADVSRRWEHLAEEGIPYVTLLYNGINHPDDRGHRIFFEELIKFFSIINDD